MHKILITFFAFLISAPLAAQELSKFEKMALSLARNQHKACQTLAINGTSPEFSIKNCQEAKDNVEKLPIEETPYSRAIQMLYTVAIDTEIVALHLDREKPDMAGCEIAKSAMRRFADFPFPFVDLDGLGQLGIRSTGRLQRFASKCSGADQIEMRAIETGELNLKFRPLLAPCKQEEGDVAEQIVACTNTLTDVEKAFDQHDSIKPVDLNAFTVANLYVFAMSFEKAERAGFIEEIICPSLKPANDLLNQFVTPISFNTSKAQEELYFGFSAYKKECAAD